MNQPGLIQPRGFASRATSAPGADFLPDELAEEAAERLRIAAMVILGLWTTLLVVNHLVAPYLDMAVDQVVPWPPIADLLAVVCIALSALVYRLAPVAAPVPGQLPLLATAYQVAVGYAIGVIKQWQPVALAGRLSWLCGGILIFPLLVPASPPVVLIGGVLTASMDPVGLAIARARGLELAPLGLLVWTYLPNYICAFLAVLSSRIIGHLGRKVRRARQYGSYRLVERIGRGGMGEVWKAEHQLFARPAAIKLIAAHGMLDESDGVAEERFRREAQVAAGLRSPHTIQLYDFGITRDRRLYYVMELLDGCDLDSLVSRYGTQPPARVANILRQACHSLAEAHAAGLVHRDIKPANLYIGRVGLEYDFVKVLDFGLVKQQAGVVPDGDIRLTAPEALSGTPAYIAPEVAAGEAVDSRADLYALGCVGYVLVTGALVFEGENAMQLILKHIRSEPVRPSVRLGKPIPVGLERLLMQCLEKDPADRPPSAAALSAALSDAGADEWTQGEARRWWETTFTPAPPREPRTEPPTELLEVAGGRDGP